MSAIVFVHSICESRLSIRVGQMQRRSKMIRAYKGWWNQPQRLVQSSEWIMSAIVFVHSICESRLSIGVCKCSGGVRCSAYNGWWNQPQRLVQSTEWIAKAIGNPDRPSCSIFGRLIRTRNQPQRLVRIAHPT